MKHLKYTVAALAIIAAASFTTSANAQTAVAGDVLLGAYDSTESGNGNSYEINLGTFSSLSNGETWNLGSTLSSLLTNGSDDLFGVSGYGTTANASFGLANNQVILPNLLLDIANSAVSGTPSSTTSGIVGAISGQNGPFNTAAASPLLTGTSSTSKSFTEVSIADGTTGSFAKAGGGYYSLGGGADNTLAVFSTSGTVEIDTLTNGGSSAVDAGTFTFSGTASDLTLTFNSPVSTTPEPSAYALGLCAIALFWVLRRRSTVA
jgi:hypothetical protein